MDGNFTIATMPITFREAQDAASSQYPHLNLLEQLWASWYIYMQNDVLATGILSFVVHELVFFGRCIPWMVADRVPYFQRYKIQGKVPSNAEIWTCLRHVLINHFTVVVPQIWLFHPAAQFFGIKTGVPFPTLTTILYQTCLFFIIEDTWHYWMHRALHTPYLYKNVHKIHHQYSAPFGMAAEYASPIEVILLGIGTVCPPIFWCATTKNLHILTMHVWVSGRLLQAIDAHSGYEFPWSLHHFLPFWAGADHHDQHHEKFMGNYASSFRWWDYFLSTDAVGLEKQRRRKRTERVGSKSE